MHNSNIWVLVYLVALYNPSCELYCIDHCCFLHWKTVVWIAVDFIVLWTKHILMILLSQQYSHLFHWEVENAATKLFNLVLRSAASYFSLFLVWTELEGFCCCFEGDTFFTSSVENVVPMYTGTMRVVETWDWSALLHWRGNSTMYAKSGITCLHQLGWKLISTYRSGLSACDADLLKACQSPFCIWHWKHADFRIKIEVQNFFFPGLWSCLYSF